MAASHEIATKGAVYTPDVLAHWAAQLLARYAPDGQLVVDPACGDGALLKAILAERKGYTVSGVDIDPEALKAARRNLPKNTPLFRADALAKRGYRLSPDAIITNPPWGASVAQPRAKLKTLGYTLATGQFDSFALFLELGLQLLRPGGVMVAIVPDSLFQREHEALRRLLAAKSLLLVARLGEGFFRGIYRGAAVIVLRNEPPAEGAVTSCLRLTKGWRQDILAGARTMAEAERELAHAVPQQRFAADPHCDFDIDAREDERHRMSLLERHIDGWTGWLTSGRGVELSKAGRVQYCPHCGGARPASRLDGNVPCTDCGRSFATAGARSETIVLPIAEGPREWKPLIVGEDVDRYRAQPSRRIKLRVRGINYKSDETFDERKIVIRKTGVGLKAAIDESGALTNQVVFIYRMKRADRRTDFLLNYFLGVLCSRVMLAYHLKAKGENEWRSHAYITQQTVAELPVPNVVEGTWQWAQARAIADAVTRCSRNEAGGDLHVDRLVAGLFELSPSDCEWILNVLDSAQQLEPIRTLRLADAKALQPLRV